MAPRVCLFGAVRCWLVLLNIFYIMVALFLIGLVIAAKTLAYNYTSVPTVIGVAVVASILFLVAVVGLFGACKHHQVILFFYMVVLGLTGFVLFAVSAATLAVPRTTNVLDTILRAAWQSLSAEQKTDIQDKFNCCGFDMKWRNFTHSDTCSKGHPMCNTTVLIGKCCSTVNTEVQLVPYNDSSCPYSLDGEFCPDCHPCYTSWKSTLKSGVLAVGSFGLIFSFTQIIGIILAFRYRNLKDPYANPSAFL